MRQLNKETLKVILIGTIIIMLVMLMVLFPSEAYLEAIQRGY